MTTTIEKTLIGLLLCGLVAAVALPYPKLAPRPVALGGQQPQSPVIVEEEGKKIILCDNGLGDWLKETNHQMGYFMARSVRIVKTGGKFQPQFKDANDTNAVWVGMFDGDKSYYDLSTAQFKVRMALMINKEVTDQMCDAFGHIGTALPAPAAKETNAAPKQASNMPPGWHIESNGSEYSIYRPEIGRLFINYGSWNEATNAAWMLYLGEFWYKTNSNWKEVSK